MTCCRNRIKNKEKRIKRNKVIHYKQEKTSKELNNNNNEINNKIIKNNEIKNNEIKKIN